MIKRTLILAALVCAMAGEMYASNTETQVVNPQPESVRILQEQLCTNPLQSCVIQARVIDIHFSITIRNKTFTVDIHAENSNGTTYFSMSVSLTENGISQSVTVTGSAPFSGNLTGGDITATIEGYIEDFTIDDVALILNAAFEQIEE